MYDLEKAKRAYEKALAVDPNIVLGHYQLARIYPAPSRIPRGEGAGFILLKGDRWLKSPLFFDSMEEL